MQVIGLRKRYFLTIFLVLFIVTVGATYSFSIFVKNERLAFIDQQVRETATALVDSDLGDLRKFDFDQAENIISEELGETRIGKFFIIRNSQGQVIFESSSASLLPITDIPQDRQWFGVSTKSQYIRVLNLKLPRIPDRTLQVGVVIDVELVHPSYFSKTYLVFVAVVLSLGLAASFFLTSFLLHPIAQLEKFLTELTSPQKSQGLLPAVPDSILKKPNAKSRDEFERVIAGLNTLISAVNKNHKLSRLWAYQMAHELKTPLALANIEIERLQKKLDLSPKVFAELTSENMKISETIGSFLSWAELENSSQQRNLFMIPLTSFIEDVIRRFQNENNRIHFEAHGDFTVTANRQHLEQLVQNLLQNAINHSPADSVISIKVNSETLEITDQGSGIPQAVLERLGEPFNRGTSENQTKKSHGLGLAWVMSICKHYGWTISFPNQSLGTRILIDFSSTLT